MRILADADDLCDDIVTFPAEQDFLVQELVDLSFETGIMYERRPGARHGRIVSLALKEAASETGDGSRSLRELIEDHPNARQLRRHSLVEHRAKLDAIPASGERIELVFAQSLRRGRVRRRST